MAPESEIENHFILLQVSWSSWSLELFARDLYWWIWIGNNGIWNIPKKENITNDICVDWVSSELIENLIISSFQANFPSFSSWRKLQLSLSIWQPYMIINPLKLALSMNIERKCWLLTNSVAQICMEICQYLLHLDINIVAVLISYRMIPSLLFKIDTNLFFVNSQLFRCIFVESANSMRLIIVGKWPNKYIFCGK